MALICINGCQSCVGCSRCQEELSLPKCPLCEAESELCYIGPDGEVVGCVRCLRLCESASLPKQRQSL